MELVKFFAKSISDQTKAAANDAGTGDTLEAGIGNLVQSAFVVIGIIAVVVVILGGVNYSTSMGDPGKTKKAKDMILYGIIGLIVAVIAFAITTFVINSTVPGKI